MHQSLIFWHPLALETLGKSAEVLNIEIVLLKCLLEQLNDIIAVNVCEFIVCLFYVSANAFETLRQIFVYIMCLKLWREFHLSYVFFLEKLMTK